MAGKWARITQQVPPPLCGTKIWASECRWVTEDRLPHTTTTQVVSCRHFQPQAPFSTSLVIPCRPFREEGPCCVRGNWRAGPFISLHAIACLSSSSIVFTSIAQWSITIWPIDITARGFICVHDSSGGGPATPTRPGWDLFSNSGLWGE